VPVPLAFQLHLLCAGDRTGALRTILLPCRTACSFPKSGWWIYTSAQQGTRYCAIAMLQGHDRE